MIKISPLEMSSFRQWLKVQDDDVRKDAQRLVVRATELMVKGAKDKAPVDHGRLRSSLQAKYSGDKLSSLIYANADYAPYQEFGTGEMVDIPPGYELIAAEFKGKGIRKVNMKAKPYFFNTFERVSKVFYNELRKMGFE